MQVADHSVCLCQVVTVGPASCIPTGHGYKGGEQTELATEVAEHLPLVAEWQLDSLQQTHRHYSNDTESADSGLLGMNAYPSGTKHVAGRIVCVQCKCTFVSKGGLNEHIKRVHQKLARYQCEACGKGYSRRSNYYDHLATHTGTKRHVCIICQTQFTFKHGLKAHVLRFHPNQIANA